jgi:hypothetical protein
MVFPHSLAPCKKAMPPTEDRQGEVVQYLPPFDVIKRPIDILSSEGKMAVAPPSYEALIKMIKSLISAIRVDEKWYLSYYPDVAEALGSGKVESAKQHFVDDGYFEGRLPYMIVVDEKWYLTRYPDVASSIRVGTYRSAQTHFLEGGYREGRLPRANLAAPI